MKPKIVPFETYADLTVGDKIIYSQDGRTRYWGRWFAPFYYRVGSVPGIHKYGNGSYLRSFRSHQKLRELYGPQEEGVPPTRKGGLRIDGCSPDPWSHDTPRSWQKCWKSQRKTQYKI